jgi:hypothetical protein
VVVTGVIRPHVVSAAAARCDDARQPGVVRHHGHELSRSGLHQLVSHILPVLLAAASPLPSPPLLLQSLDLSFALLRPPQHLLPPLVLLLALAHVTLLPPRTLASPLRLLLLLCTLGGCL